VGSAAPPLPALTSLRFFAAALIVFGHGASKAYFDYALPAFDVRQSVSFFFVLSGFILTHVYRHAHGWLAWRQFATARFARIWPVHAVTALLAIETVAPPDGAHPIMLTAVNLLLGQAAVPLAAWHYSLNAVAWSISAEAFFYVAFPLLLVLVLTRGSRALLAPAALLAAVIVLAVVTRRPLFESAPGVTAWGLLYISPTARVLEFAVGIFAYEALYLRRSTHPKKGWATLRELLAIGAMLAAMIAAPALADAIEASIASQASVWVRTAAPFPCFAVAIAILARRQGVISQGLALRPLVYLGEISYSLYMIHQLVVRNLFLHADTWARLHPSVAYACYWLAALGMAAGLYHWIEQPMRQRLRRTFAPARASSNLT